MKNAYFILTLVFALLFSACNTKTQTAIDNEVASLEDLYFGLEPPGVVAKPFTPGIDWELGGMHGQGLEEFYFTPSVEMPLSPLVVSFRKENGSWKNYQFYSTGGDTMYSKDKYIERTETGWSEIKSLGAPFDSIPIMRLTASAKGTLVF